MKPNDSRRPILTRAISGVLTPAIVIASVAGSASTAFAQDESESGAFGLLQAFTQQADQQPEQDPGYDDTYYEDQQFDDTNSEEDLAALEGAVGVNEYDLVDLHVNNEDLGNILQLLSIQSERNIISSNAVQASVTADLYGVTFYEALDAILHVNGFGYIERGNFIYVYTREELEAFEQAARTRVSRVITLDYLNAADAAEFARQLLTDDGSITTHAATESFSIQDGVPVGADNYASTAQIVIHDYEENVEEIMALISELDTKPEQVLIESTILQTTLNEANAFGVDFALIKNLNFTDFVGDTIGGPLNVIDGLISGRGETVAGTAVNVPNGTSSDAGGVQSNAGNTSGPGTLKAGLVNGDVAVFMRVLDEVTDVTVVSNPKILTLNRQPARVLVGTRVGYLNTTTTQTSTTQTVEFLDVGTQLAVRPFVSKNGIIRLELRPQVSSFTLREITDSGGNAVTIPDEDTTEMTTNVMVRDGQTVVLGGLFTETTTATRRQVPLLGDIPIIGAAFKGHDDSTRRSEIIFLITPSLVNDTNLTQDGALAEDYIEHARFGSRKGLLPWSRERRVGQLLIDARRLADDGMVEKALAKIDLALHLYPMSTDARALRTELTSELKVMPNRSMLKHILQDELIVPNDDRVVYTKNFFNAWLDERKGDNDQPVDSSEVAGASDPSNAQPYQQVEPQFLSDEIAQEQQNDQVETFDPSFEEQDPSDSTIAEVTETGPMSDASTDSEYVEVFEPESFSDEVAMESNPTPIADEFAQEPSSESDWLISEVDEFGSFEDAQFDVFANDNSLFAGPLQEDQSFTDNESWNTILSEAPQNLADPFYSHELSLQDPNSAGSFMNMEYQDEYQGQLIIALPNGGAFQIDWPLTMSDWTHASNTDDSDESSSDEETTSTFATVPTSDD